MPYRDGATPRRYLPDFIVKLDDGSGPDDPLHLVIEIKGYRGINAQLKAEVMSAFWVPGVNNLKTHGHWAFAELRDGYAMEEQYAQAVSRLTRPRQAAE